MIKDFLNTAKDTFSAYKWWTSTSLRSKFGSKIVRSRSTHKHLLLLAWTFPPDINGGIYRPSALVRYGTKLGWKISVIAGPLHDPSTTAGEYQTRSLPNDVVIHRITTPRFKPSWNWFPRIDGGFLNALCTASLAEQLFENDPPSIVMASGPPFHNFHASFYIARYYHAKLVLDYRDEWTEGTRAFVKLGSVDRKCERHCLREANAVIFTTESVRSTYLAAFPEIEAPKCTVIPNGWDPEEYEAANHLTRNTFTQNDKVVVSHVGTLNEHMLPKDFLDTLEVVIARRHDLRQRIKFYFVGKTGLRAQEQLQHFAYQDILKFNLQYVPKPEAISIMQQSSALLILNGSEHCRILPAKIYEYLATGRPILVFGEGGETANLITRLNAGIVIPMRHAGELELSLEKLNHKTDHKNRQGLTEDWLNSYTRQLMAKRMINLLNQLIGQNSYHLQKDQSLPLPGL